jgi:molybdate transport system substrate-binding protein
MRTLHSAKLVGTLILATVWAATTLAARAEKVSVAAAANLLYVLDALKTEFVKTNPSVQLEFVTGASGNLFAQVNNGAPHDVFMSADRHYPEQLVAAGSGESPTLCIFAVGRLALWTVHPDLRFKDVQTGVNHPLAKKIALANPQTAPYGKAAVEALTKLGVAQMAADKQVYGENITQTAQFVETGNAQLGFVALSHVLSPKLKNKGYHIEVPAALHSPLEHAAVVTRHGKNKPAAAAFMAFLTSAAAQEILTDHGYSAVDKAPKG